MCLCLIPFLSFIDLYVNSFTPRGAKLLYGAFTSRSAKNCILLTQCIYMFHMVHTVHSCFSMQLSSLDPSNRSTLCSLWLTKWVFLYIVDWFSLQNILFFCFLFTCISLALGTLDVSPDLWNVYTCIHYELDMMEHVYINLQSKNSLMKQRQDRRDRQDVYISVQVRK